jgi:Poxvirus A32 protein
MNVDWKNFFTMVIYGLPGSGKSSLLRYLIYSASCEKKFDHCLLFSGTKGGKDYDFLDAKYKYDAFDNNVIEKYIEICQKKNEKAIKTRGLLIFDDICGEQNFKSDLFKKLFSNYRHYGISVIVCQQMPVELPLSIRSIVKYGVIYKYVNESQKEKIYNCFGTLAKSRNDFNEIYDKYTDEKYKALFFNGSDVYNSTNAYTGIRAPLVPAFKINF